MIANYRETDFSILFLGSPHVGPELAAVLAKEGLLSGVDTQQATDTDLLTAVAKFAQAHGLTAKNINLEVIDRLGLLDIFARPPKLPAY